VWVRRQGDFTGTHRDMCWRMNAGDGTTGKQVVGLFFTRALDLKRFSPIFSVDISDMLI